jgi:hypothetical protein
MSFLTFHIWMFCSAASAGGCWLILAKGHGAEGEGTERGLLGVFLYRPERRERGGAGGTEGR